MENRDAYLEGLLRQLTLEEKIGMVHGAGLFRTKGVERLGIPPLRMSDGPMGVRREMADDAWAGTRATDDFVTYLPSGSAVAATWNRALAHGAGKALGGEARGRGKDVILAPGVNIKRDPRCGRNFEYMSEDPYLTAEIAVPLIKGIQENDVSACVKHFAVNSQETDRLEVDERVPEQALREIYLPAFRAAVRKAGARALMCAYNRLNGARCSESKALLGDILRDEWGFDGAVISDWGAVHSTRQAAPGPVDVEMDVTPNFDEYHFARPLADAVRRGEVEEARLDEKVLHILRLMLRLKMIGPDAAERRAGTFNTPENRAAALAVARESVVLLQNRNNRLPFRRPALKKLLVVGKNAEAQHAPGGGSAEIKALYEISPLLGLRMRLGGNTEIRYAPGYLVRPPRGNGEPPLTQEQRDETAAEEKRLRDEACALAAEYDDVLFIGGLDHTLDVEGLDRADLSLPYGQDALIRALLEANPRTVLAFVGGSPVDMRGFAPQAEAIVWSWYAGCEGGTALAEVLLGEINPSGRLPETFPLRLEDCPAQRLGEFGNSGHAEHREGIFVGYRYYDRFGVAPLFPFGHGLSYTSFAYRDASADVSENDGGLTVSVRVLVKNTGARTGAEVVQVYTGRAREEKNRPVRELRGFEKVFLEPGEEREIVFSLGAEAFAAYRESARAFVAEPGEYAVSLGSSSRDLRAACSVRIAHEHRFR